MPKKKKRVIKKKIKQKKTGKVFPKKKKKPKLPSDDAIFNSEIGKTDALFINTPQASPSPIIPDQPAEAVPPKEKSFWEKIISFLIK